MSGPAPLAIVTGAGSGVGFAFAKLLESTSRAELKDLTIIAVDKSAQVNGLNSSRIQSIKANIDLPEGCEAVMNAVDGRPIQILVHFVGEAEEATKPAWAGAFQLTSMLNDCLRTWTDARAQDASTGLGGAVGGTGKVMLSTGGGVEIEPEMRGEGGGTIAALKQLWLPMREEYKEYADVALCKLGVVKSPIWDKYLSGDYPSLQGFGPRWADGDCHSPEEAAEWMLALTDESVCSREEFREREHNIDNPNHSANVKIKPTTEGKLFCSKKFTCEPIGMKLGENIIVNDILAGGQAEMSGVAMGWALVSVGDVDVAGKTKREILSVINRRRERSEDYQMSFLQGTELSLVFKATGGVGLNLEDGGSIRATREGSQAAERGVQPNWRIVRIGDTDCRSFIADEFTELLGKKKDEGIDYIITFMRPPM